MLSLVWKICFRATSFDTPVRFGGQFGFFNPILMVVSGFRLSFNFSNPFPLLPLFCNTAPTKARNLLQILLNCIMQSKSNFSIHVTLSGVAVANWYHFLQFFKISTNSPTTLISAEFSSVITIF